MKTREAVIQAGKTRIIPVLLTALAAILASDTAGRWFQYQLRYPVLRIEPAYFLWW